MPTRSYVEKLKAILNQPQPNSGYEVNPRLLAQNCLNDEVPSHEKRCGLGQNPCWMTYADTSDRHCQKK